jgi:hypothetical protein
MASKDYICEHDKKAGEILTTYMSQQGVDIDTKMNPTVQPVYSTWRQSMSRDDTPQSWSSNCQEVVDLEQKSEKRYKLVRVFGSRKYKPVGVKVKPIKTHLPEEFRIEREIIGDPLEGMPELPTNPPEFTPGKRYTEESKKVIDDNHPEGFLWEEERKLMHSMMKLQEEGFAWETEEAGNFRKDFFPPVKFPVVPHTPWVERNIPIPPGIYPEVCKLIKAKIDAGTYEPSNSSY